MRRVRLLHETLYFVRGRTDIPYQTSGSLFSWGTAMAQTAARHFSYENRIRELIRLFVHEHDPEKRKVLAAELQRLLVLESTARPIWHEHLWPSWVRSPRSLE